MAEALTPSRRHGLRLALLTPMLALACAGCASLTHTTYVAPELPVSAAWDVRPSGAVIAREGAWWNQFGDAGLTTLVDNVLAANGDLAAAGIRLRQARMSADLAASQLRPTFTGNLSTGGSQALDGGNGWSENASASLGASWEVDLFGRLGAQRDAAEWAAQASAQDLAATRLSLVGTAVSAWWQLGYANERIVIAEQSLAYTQRALTLVQLQYQAGAVSQIELRDAEQSLAAQQATLTQLTQARVEARNALAALLGQQSYTGAELQVLPIAPLPAVSAGLPAELLGRRPDLAAAELRLRQSLATSDATEAGFYPQLNLTGSLGTASSTLIDIISNPVASLGAAISLPFLNPDRVRLQTGIARADYDIAVAEFRQDFYEALRDTGNALSQREQLIGQAVLLQRSLSAADDAEGLYERRYRAGAIALRAWLDAQERLRTSQVSLLDNRLSQLNAQVSLYQALGGDAATTGE